MRLKQDLIDLVELHERTCPGDGRPCVDTRIALIAFLCHGLGVKPAHFPDLARAVEENDRRCPCAESRRLIAESN